MPPSKAERKQFITPEYKSKKADSSNKATIQHDKRLINVKV
jgi:hypothetical protein